MSSQHSLDHLVDPALETTRLLGGGHPKGPKSRTVNMCISLEMCSEEKSGLLRETEEEALTLVIRDLFLESAHGDELKGKKQFPW